MTVRFTPQALAELDAILDYVAERSSSGANRIQRRIKTLIDLLPHFPLAGQGTDIARLRRLVVTPFPYVIYYRTDDDDIVVVSVRHSARKAEPGR
ncbi:MAG TPA: type II toxin-antitoxin system RelE/ParE family toxin [Devosia sp.]|uniref:type II toxin-antitoxin system RelE/ParE family toxin n=1 Tax=Devosia sp. TaxID=1871048 RepID=UPI002F9364F4